VERALGAGEERGEHYRRKERSLIHLFVNGKIGVKLPIEKKLTAI